MMLRENTLFVTHCSAGKNQVHGGPLDLYTSDRIQRFGNWCNYAGVQWAIVSAKYGLFFPHESRGPYDMELSFSYGECLVFERGQYLSESEAHVKRLVGTIGARLKEQGVREVVFYAGGRRPWAYLLVVHSAVDNCVRRHNSREDVQRCWEEGGRLRLAGGMADVEAELGRLR
jgi:hypothetical protein